MLSPSRGKTPPRGKGKRCEEERGKCVAEPAMSADKVFVDGEGYFAWQILAVRHSILAGLRRGVLKNGICGKSMHSLQVIHNSEAKTENSENRQNIERIRRMKS